MDSKGFESDYKRHRFSAHLEGMVAASAAGFFSFWAGCTCVERSCLERAAFAPLRHHLPVNARSCAAFAPLRHHLSVNARSGSELCHRGPFDQDGVKKEPSTVDQWENNGITRKMQPNTVGQLEKQWDDMKKATKLLTNWENNGITWNTAENR